MIYGSGRTRLLSLLPLLPLLPLLSLGCGGAAPPVAPTSAGAGASSETPGERCLAVAGAKRTRRPDEPAQIHVSHVLVKYAGVRKETPATITRTREQACLRAEEARGKLESGAPFAEVVGAYSEEPGAATRDGSLGAVDRRMLVAAFADAAFELKAGDVSHVVETEFGFHLILRTE